MSDLQDQHRTVCQVLERQGIYTLYALPVGLCSHAAEGTAVSDSGEAAIRSAGAVSQFNSVHPEDAERGLAATFGGYVITGAWARSTLMV